MAFFAGLILLAFIAVFALLTAAFVFVAPLVGSLVALSHGRYRLALLLPLISIAEAWAIWTWRL
jgi:hypothetical protein